MHLWVGSGWVSRSSLGRETLSGFSLFLELAWGCSLESLHTLVCGERLDEAEATLILPVILVDRDKGQSWAGDQTQICWRLPFSQIGKGRLENRQMQPELVVSTEKNGVQSVWFGRGQNALEGGYKLGVSLAEAFLVAGLAPANLGVEHS